MENILLKPVDRIEITVLVDNYSDLLFEDSDIVKRMRVMPPSAVMAELGLPCLLTVYDGDDAETVLMDTGISGTCLNHKWAMLSSSLGANATRKD